MINGQWIKKSIKNRANTGNEFLSFIFPKFQVIRLNNLVEEDQQLTVFSIYWQKMKKIMKLRTKTWQNGPP